MSTGLLVWIVSGVVLYPPIVKLIVDEGYPAFLNEIFFFCQYVVIGFGLGFCGKYRGWILGLILGVIIALCFILLSLTSPIQGFGIEKSDKINSFGSIILSHSIFTIYLIIGGYLGELLRNRKKPGDNRVGS